MRNMLKHGFAALALCAGIAVLGQTPARAQSAVVCVNCATIATQGLQWAQQVQQWEEQVSQYATQLQQYANQVQNTTAIPSQIYSNAMSDMQAVQNLMTQGTQLSFSNPGSSLGTFSSYLSSTSSTMGNLTAQATQYQTWSQQSKDGITAAMNALGQQNSQLSTDNNTMTQLQAQQAASTGQMQAIQNAAEISAQQVREIEKLRQLIMVQTQLAANQQAIQSQQQASSQAQWQNFMSSAALPTTGTTYK
ncbi:P-type conjugative transfer protein TrbJ [Acidisoma cladoniae]|jgi:P-type conjugative transfer protein TrbJ|uniref:P-type conjugative transfer protein TrbJ n=1 Tax=Acidisoma cladoniae TaxID=3040935 RepID=UPI00254DAC11|nr:P-type conjugative transfer protein TrbJ [Acidisoma sp. PAMC 29798]